MLPVILCIAVIVVFLIRSARPKGSVTLSHHRGATLQSESEVEATLKALPSHSKILIGKLAFPAFVAPQHFALVGATGSGKTILQRLLMQSSLPLIGRGLGHRALIYDAKRDLMGILAGMKLPCPVYLINPMDARGVAWDMAADITTAPAAHQLARTLIPVNENDQNRFFPDAARSLLEAVFLFLIRQHPGTWTLRQALCLTRDPKLLEEVLHAHSDSRELLNLFEYKPTLQNIMSAVVTYLRPYQLIAAAWDRADSKISLCQWTQTESILVLGNDESNRAAMDTLHRLVFSRVAELLLNETELHSGPKAGTSWIFLDEVREAKKLDKLSQLLTQGRSKGVSVVLGFQDIEGLRHVYGEKVANELVGQCATKVILRLQSPETAAWASKVFGNQEVMESRRGTSSSHQTDQTLAHTVGHSTSLGISTRPLIMDSEFMALPETSFDSGLSAYVKSPLSGAFKTHVPGHFLKENLLPADSHTPNLIPINPLHWFLNPLSDQDAPLLQSLTPKEASNLDCVHPLITTLPPHAWS